METFQLYETVISLRDKDLAVRVTVAPKTTFIEPVNFLNLSGTTLGNQLFIDDFQPIDGSAMLPAAITAILTKHKNDTNNALKIFRDTWQSGSIYPPNIYQMDDEIYEFATYISFADLIPWEESLIKKTSLGNIIAKNRKALIGVVVAGGFIGGILGISSLVDGTKTAVLVAKAENEAIAIVQEAPRGIARGIETACGVAIVKGLLEQQKIGRKGTDKW